MCVSLSLSLSLSFSLSLYLSFVFVYCWQDASFSVDINTAFDVRVWVGDAYCMDIDIWLRSVMRSVVIATAKLCSMLYAWWLHYFRRCVMLCSLWLLLCKLFSLYSIRCVCNAGFQSSNVCWSSIRESRQRKYPSDVQCRKLSPPFAVLLAVCYLHWLCLVFPWVVGQWQHTRPRRLLGTVDY